MASTARPLANGSSWDDADYLNDLLDAIQADPQAIEARQLLAAQYVEHGWDEAAICVAEDILRLDPFDDGALAILMSYGRIEHPTPPLITPATPVRPKPGFSKSKVSSSNSKKRVVIEKAAPAELKSLRDGYESLQKEAAELVTEIMTFKELAPDYECGGFLASLQTMLAGRIFSASRGRTGSSPSKEDRKSSKTKAAKASRPKSAKELANAMKANPSKAVEVAIEEFEKYPPKATPGPKKEADDILRDAVRKRTEEVKVLLPKNIAPCASDAFMHIEHEFLGRTYVNDETMLGDSISEIPRENFFASEDGYAWDMSELVQAVKANGGVMRNPLSKDSFTVADVEGILRHHLGKELAALQVEQSRLFQGVRPETVLKLDSMATILLGDDAEDSRISRAAVDDFFTYIATLPQTERQAIDKLRVPAKDSHTGKNYDATIGDALRDAKANLLCFHKAGDLLQQAAVYLKKGKGGSSRAY